MAAASSGGGAYGASPASAAADVQLGPVKEEIKEVTTRLNTAAPGQQPPGPMRRFQKQVMMMQEREDDRERRIMLATGLSPELQQEFAKSKRVERWSVLKGERKEAARIGLGIVSQSVARRMGLPEVPEGQRSLLQRTSRMVNPMLQRLGDSSSAGGGGTYGTSAAAMTDMFRPSPGINTHDGGSRVTALCHRTGQIHR